MLPYQHFFLLVAVALLLAPRFTAATPFTASEGATRTSSTLSLHRTLIDPASPSIAVKPTFARSDNLAHNNTNITNIITDGMSSNQWSMQAAVEVYMRSDVIRNSMGNNTGSVLYGKI